MKIREIYRILCWFYEPSVVVDIDSYLIDTPPRHYADRIGSRTSDRETLFIRQIGDEYELGLFIAPGILAAIDRTDPLERMDEFFCAVEGVSHILMLLDRIANQVATSHLELELQAEVDKFLISHLYMSKARRGASIDLFDRQFERCTWDSNLSEDDLLRYTAASRMAAKFCSGLRERYFNPARIGEMKADVLDFFKRNLAQKVSILTP